MATLPPAGTAVAISMADTFQESRTDPDDDATHCRNAIDDFEPRVTGKPVGKKPVGKPERRPTYPTAKNAPPPPRRASKTTAAPPRPPSSQKALPQKASSNSSFVTKGEGPSEEQQDKHRDRADDMKSVRDLDSFKVPL